MLPSSLSARGQAFLDSLFESDDELPPVAAQPSVAQHSNDALAACHRANQEVADAAPEHDARSALDSDTDDDGMWRVAVAEEEQEERHADEVMSLDVLLNLSRRLFRAALAALLKRTQRASPGRTWP